MLQCPSSSSTAQESVRLRIARRCSGSPKTRAGTGPLPLPIFNVSGGSVSQLCSLFPSFPSQLSVARSPLCRCFLFRIVRLLVPQRSSTRSRFRQSPAFLFAFRCRSATDPTRPDSIRASVLPPFVAPVSLPSQRLNSYGAQQSFQQPSQQNGGGYNGQGY